VVDAEEMDWLELFGLDVKENFRQHVLALSLNFLE
jgi:hypothetical protein